MEAVTKKERLKLIRNLRAKNIIVTGLTDLTDNPDVKIRRTIVVQDDWGPILGKLIAASEARVTSFKKMTQEAYKAGNRELIPLFKEMKKSEEKLLKSRRWEKTCWNARVWEWYFRNPVGGKIQ